MAREFIFQAGEYYHVYNRGVDKRDIFIDEKDYIKFIYKINDHNDVMLAGDKLLRKLRDKQRFASGTPSVLGDTGCLEYIDRKLVAVICYSLIPNHYHLVLMQLREDGISKFMHRLAMGYAKYFNQKYNRSGALFQSKFQAVHIETDEYLLWLSGYVNGNAEIHRVAKSENWLWGSYPDYLSKRQGRLCNKKVILDQFNDISEYRNLVDMVIKDSRERKDEIKKYFLE